MLTLPSTHHSGPTLPPKLTFLMSVWGTRFEQLESTVPKYASTLVLTFLTKQFLFSTNKLSIFF